MALVTRSETGPRPAREDWGVPLSRTHILINRTLLLNVKRYAEGCGDGSSCRYAQGAVVSVLEECRDAQACGKHSIRTNAAHCTMVKVGRGPTLGSRRPTASPRRTSSTPARGDRVPGATGWRPATAAWAGTLRRRGHGRRLGPETTAGYRDRCRRPRYPAWVGLFLQVRLVRRCPGVSHRRLSVAR